MIINNKTFFNENDQRRRDVKTQKVCKQGHDDMSRKFIGC